MPRDVEIQGDLAISGTVDGVDVAATGALAASATQPGDNLSTLMNDILASQGEAEAGSNNTKMMTPLRVAQAIAILAAGIQNKYNGTVNPTTTNDDTEGYSIGSVWINTTSDEAFRCVDNTTNLAIWVNTTLTASELATVGLTGNSDDLTEGVTKLLMTPTERTKLAGLGGTPGYVAKTAAYNVAITDGTVDCTANSFVLTLLDAVATPYRVHHLKNSGAGVITINTTSGQTIDGQASGAISLTQYENLTVQSNGVNWIIL
jgi:hypothetical protein